MSSPSPYRSKLRGKLSNNLPDETLINKPKLRSTKTSLAAATIATPVLSNRDSESVTVPPEATEALDKVKNDAVYVAKESEPEKPKGTESKLDEKPEKSIILQQTTSASLTVTNQQESTSLTLEACKKIVLDGVCEAKIVETNIGPAKQLEIVSEIRTDETNIDIFNDKPFNSIAPPNIEEIKAKLAKIQFENEAKIKKLIRERSANCDEVEQLAMDFLCDETHHPVLTCFRELMNSNDFSAIMSNKHKKFIGDLEFSIVCIGMLDCMAMTLHNPFYQESYNISWNRKISSKVEKVLFELKPTLTSWGISGRTFEQERFKILMNYLRRLVPFFKPIDFDQSYEASLSAIENDITRMSLLRQERSRLTSSICNEIQRKCPNITLKPLSTFSTPTVSPQRFHLGQNNSGHELSTPPSPGEENKKVVSSNFTGHPPCPVSPQKKANILLNSNNSNISSPEPALLSVSVSETVCTISDVSDTDFSAPLSKKAKLDPSSEEAIRNSQPTPCVTGSEKPKVNAFALMMNRSRQLAKESKTKQSPNVLFRRK